MEIYEKKYKEALEIIKGNLNALNEIAETGAETVNIQSIKNCFYRAFSELKESEDEKIRKEIISFIQDHFDEINFQVSGDYDNRDKEDIALQEWCKEAIAWLEKQEEYISTDFDYVWERTDCGELTSALDKYSSEAIKKMCHAWYDKGIELERKSWLEKQGEKSNFRERYKKISESEWFKKTHEGMSVSEEEISEEENVEPKSKFHEGDWVVCEELNTAKIISLDNDRYEVEFVDGNKGFPHIDYIDRNFHLWSIQDAKDGDVLYCESSGIEFIIILKQINNRSLDSYCRYNTIDGFAIDVPRVMSIQNNPKPATKEQRDLLFAKMKEAGYEWDTEKKELRKIEPFDKYEGLTDFERTLADICIGWIGEELGWKQYIKDNADVLLKIAIEKFNSVQDTPFEQKSAWSEEDEVRLQACIDRLQAKSLMGKVDTVMTNWLKTLKERIGG